MVQWGWIGSVHCEKFRCDFMAQTCALIAPFQPVLLRVSSINETLPNALKHYETHQNMSLGFNWVDWVCSFWKILTRLHGTNLYINSTISASLHRLSCSNETIQNAPKHYEMHQIMSLGSNGVDWVRSLRKILMRLHGMNLCINCTSSTHFAPIFM